ncbi:MAG: SMP-30/gluconolactonase/LRE family protein [Bacteroidota bacterium]
MKKIICLFLLSVQFFQGSAQETKPGIGSIEFISKDLSKLINNDAKVEIIASGFQFTEGPLWMEKEQMLLFSDVPGNTIYKWTEANGKEVYVKPGGYTDTAKRGGFMGSDALAISRDGRLMICQHGDRRVAIMDAPLNAPQSKFITLAGQYDGKRLNSPNDLFLAKNGDLYFTDPSYGLERGARDPKKELSFQGVYKLNKAGKVTLLIDSLELPNGIGILPDGKTLLVSNTEGKKRGWYAYDISKDGSLTNGRTFYSPGTDRALGMGGCDGFKIDKNGNVFAAGPGGIWIFTQTGELIGKIKINGVTAANCALTPDGKTIYITATQYLLKVKMR